MERYRNFRKLEDLLLEGRRVFIRVDYDVPLTEDGVIADDTLLEASLPTIKYAIEQGARIVLAGHLGMPYGKRVAELSMITVGERLRELISREMGREYEIYMPEEVVGDGPRKVVMERLEGEVVLLENLFFYPEEEANDSVFAQRLAALADVYVNDAPYASGRPLASLSAAKHLTERGIGLLLSKEIANLSKIASTPEQPFVVVMGGATFSEKLSVLNSLLGKAKTCLFGGAIALTLLASRGVCVGRSRFEAERLEAAQNFLTRAKLRGVEILLPSDVVVQRGDAIDVVQVDQIPEDSVVMDIGPNTVQSFNRILKNARTVLWNGPLGVCEDKRFIAGTEGVAKAIARSSAFSVVVGNHTVAVVNRLVLTPFFRHVSLGGESALAFIEGRELPGLEAMLEVA